MGRTGDAGRKVCFTLADARPSDARGGGYMDARSGEMLGRVEIDVPQEARFEGVPEVKSYSVEFPEPLNL